MQAFDLIQRWVVTSAWLHTGPPRDFVLDSGIGWTVITPTTAQALGLLVEDHDPELTPLLRQSEPDDPTAAEPRPPVRYARLPLLRVAGLTLRNQRVLVMDLPGLHEVCAAEGREVAGVLGYNVLRATRLTLDYPRRVVRLHRDG